MTGSWPLGPLDHFWSLAIEEHFYLVWPAVIYFLSRTAALRICGALFAASVLARTVWLVTGGNDVAAEVFTLLRMDGLVLGSWLALAARRPGGLAALHPWAAPAVVLFGLIALSADILGRRLLGLPLAAWALACGALLVLTVAASPQSLIGRLGNARTLRFFGKYSYAMYVFQLPLVYVLAPLVTAAGLAQVLGGSVFGQAAYCAILFLATTLIAVISWHVFEKRFLSLKHRFGG